MKITKPRPGHTSISINTAIIDAVDARRRDGETRSARLERDTQDYQTLLAAGLRKAQKALAPAEALAVLDVQNGAATAPAHWLGQSLANQIDDAIALDGLAEKYSINGPVLIGKLTDLGDMACVALVDWAAQTWASGADAAEAVEIFKGA